MKWSREKLLPTLLVACIGLAITFLLFKPNNIHQIFGRVTPIIPRELANDYSVDPTKDKRQKQVLINAQTEPSDNSLILDSIYQLIESDPQQAAAFLDRMKLTSKGALTLSLVKNWSLTEPEKALSWYQTLQDELSKSEYETGMRALLLRYAKHSPQTVFYDLQEHFAPEHHSEIIVAVADGWASKDPEQAIVWLREIAVQGSVPQAALDDAYAAIMSHYLNHAPDVISIVLMESEGVFNNEQIVPELAVKQAEKDMIAAIDWLASTQPEHVQNTSFIAMANARVEQDPEGALTLLTEIREITEDNEQSFAEAIARVVKHADHWIWNNFDQIPLHIHYAASSALAERALRGKLSLEKYRLWLRNAPSRQALEGGEEMIRNYQEVESSRVP